MGNIKSLGQEPTQYYAVEMVEVERMVGGKDKTRQTLSTERSEMVRFEKNKHKKLSKFIDIKKN